VAEALRAALDGYSGSMGEETSYAVFIEDERDTYDPETGLMRVIVDYTIWHKEA
jgi:hypothetical protein